MNPHKRSLVSSRLDQAFAMLEDCTVCPNECHVNRLRGEKGRCCTGRNAIVASYGPHFGEEAPLVGRQGSGTIFFTYCNLACSYCQNYAISQLGEGREVSADALSAMMLELQKAGCHNINLVSPTHVVPQVLEAVGIALDRGLSLPLVYNSGGYDCGETLRLLDGIVDIYMPDMKYADADTAQRYSGVADYPRINRIAVKEMHRQVGDLRIDADGVARRGLLIRHLVLPGGLAGTSDIAKFIYEEVSPDTYLNIMAQYRPAYKAYEMPIINRPTSRQEYLEAVKLAQDQGLCRLDRVRSV